MLGTRPTLMISGPGASVLTNLGRGVPELLIVGPKNIIFGKTSSAKDTQKYKLNIFQCSTFPYGRQQYCQHGLENRPFKTFSFNSSLLYAIFIQKYKFSAKWEPKYINLDREKTRSKNICLEKIFGPNNIGHASLPILNGSAPPPPPRISSTI